MHLGFAAILQAEAHVLQSLNPPQLGYIQHSMCEDNCVMQQLQVRVLSLGKTS